jgi:hypothetical protein
VSSPHMTDYSTKPPITELFSQELVADLQGAIGPVYKTVAVCPQSFVLAVQPKATMGLALFRHSNLNVLITASPFQFANSFAPISKTAEGVVFRAGTAASMLYFKDVATWPLFLLIEVDDLVRKDYFKVKVLKLDVEDICGNRLTIVKGDKLWRRFERTPELQEFKEQVLAPAWLELRDTYRQRAGEHHLTSLDLYGQLLSLAGGRIDIEKINKELLSMRSVESLKSIAFALSKNPEVKLWLSTGARGANAPLSERAKLFLTTEIPVGYTNRFIFERTVDYIGGALNTPEEDDSKPANKYKILLDESTHDDTAGSGGEPTTESAD